MTSSVDRRLSPLTRSTPPAAASLPRQPTVRPPCVFFQVSRRLMLLSSLCRCLGRHSRGAEIRHRTSISLLLPSAQADPRVLPSQEFISDDPERDIKTFLLTAAAIGMLYKRGATISAAEGGCMAEVGVASSMVRSAASSAESRACADLVFLPSAQAAAGFTACLGGSPQMILQAAEIGIEHSLGLTCDPLDGQVIIPCIERNSLGAVKAVCAAQLAMAGDGTHSVSLDEAIEAMRRASLLIRSICSD